MAHTIECYNNICTIGFYYGKFNNYFELFLKSCRYNPKIDFIIITDIEYPNELLPSNVRIISMTIDYARNLASKKLSIDVQVMRPYKFCDLRPFYGIILEDYIKLYDYWGWYDFDVIFGDVFGYMKSYKYINYDKFLPMGHLSFMRNTPEVNSYYKLPCSTIKTDWYKALTTPENIYFDENCGMNAILIDNNKSIFTRRIFADISPRFKRFTISESCSLDGYYAKNYKYQIFYWKEGIVYRDYYEDGIIKTDEFMYIHLQKRPNYIVHSDIINSNEFYITPSGFICKSGRSTLNIIKQLNPYPIFGDKVTAHYLKFVWHLKMDWRIKKLKKKIGFK